MSKKNRVRALAVFGASLLAGCHGTPGSEGRSEAAEPAPASWPNSGAVRIEGATGGDKPIGARAPATSRALSLKGSRGETLNFQLHVSGPGCYTLALEGVAGSGASLRLYAMEPMRTEHPSFPGAYVGDILDPLVPAAGRRICPAQTRG